MIIAKKDLNINTNIIKITSKIIKYLITSENKEIKFNNLVDRVIEENGENAKMLITPSLIFLYSLDKIEFDDIKDKVMLKKGL